MSSHELSCLFKIPLNLPAFLSLELIFSMATTATFFLHLFLLFISVFSTITTAQQARNSNIIPLNSSLSLTNINTTFGSWLSPSGRFAFGFYPQDGGFVVGIWFAQIPQKTVVWTTANLVKQTDSNNFILRLIRDGGLNLEYTAQGEDQSKIISPISEVNPRVSYASMLDTGNMVLYNADSRVLWQSFDFPSNTLLQGQRLGTGKELYSSVSETDYSKGTFLLAMQADGNLVLYPTQRRDVPGYAYWATDVFGDNLTLNLDDDGRLCLLNSNGTNIRDLSRPTARNGTMFYRLTVEINGILTLYSHNLPGRNGDWSVEWSGPDGKCQPVGLCGPNGYCNVVDQEAECLCLPGFNLTLTARLNSLGCRRETSLEACGSEKDQSKNTMLTLINTVRWEADIYFSLTPTTEEECESACLNDCNCEAAMFENQNCRKVKLPLRNAVRQVSSSKVFIKVGTKKKNNTNTTSTTTTITTTREVVKENKRSKKKLQLAILIASVSFVTSVLIILGISVFLIYRHRTWSRYKILQQGNNGLNEAISLQSFTYDELEKATNNFKEVVGRGSFGTVFKGALYNERLIAVKRLEKMVNEGEREFQAEMRTIGRLHHKNLVQLLGYCHEETNRLLVYEYMSNGSLADFLFRSEEIPGWNERVQIALGIARGILYLHEDCKTQIIHCDIKPQNILMDEYRFAKIADFGLAKLLKKDQSMTYTGIRGTRGYVAPEWHRNLPVTVKVDVYSFGIVLLEIICCRRSLNMELPEDEVVLVDWVFQCFDIGELHKLVSDEEVDMKRFERMISVALWCIQDEPSIRPSMKNVVLMLEGTTDIPIPPSPTSFLSSI